MTSKIPTPTPNGIAKLQAATQAQSGPSEGIPKIGDTLPTPASTGTVARILRGPLRAQVIVEVDLEGQA